MSNYFTMVQTILKIPGFTDNVVTHLLSGLGAGFFAVCIGSPVDVVFFNFCILIFLIDLELFGLCHSNSVPDSFYVC